MILQDKEGYMSNELKIIDKVLEADLCTEEGLNLKLGGYLMQQGVEEKECALIYKGAIACPQKPILLRINSACFTGDIFHCARCDCSWQLKEAMKKIAEEGGLIIYQFDHEGRGHGFVSKLKSFVVMDRYQKTSFEAFEHLGQKPDKRDFLASVLILKDLGVQQVRLISNNPQKKDFLMEHGIDVLELIPSIVPDKRLRPYLLSKKNQFGHLMEFDKLLNKEEGMA